VENVLVVNYKNDPLLAGIWPEHDRDVVAFLVHITQHAARNNTNVIFPIKIKITYLINKGRWEIWVGFGSKSF